MKCNLCDKEIENYSPEFNRLDLGEAGAAAICRECVDKFMKWQGKKYASLFPTSAMKKRFGSGRKP